MRYNWDPNDQQNWEMNCEAEWLETVEKNYKLLKVGDLVKLSKSNYPQYKDSTGILLQTVGEGYWEVFINGNSHPYRIHDEDITEIV